MKTNTCLYLFTLHVLLLLHLNSAQQIVNANNSTNVSTSDPFLDYEDYDQDYSYVGSLKFHLKESKVPKILTEVSMHNMNCPIQNCQVSLIDVVDAIQLQRFNMTTLVAAIEKLNINEDDAYNICLIYNCTAKQFEYLLQTFLLTFSELYKNFVESLTNPSQSIPAILNTLNVSVIDFMNAQAYGNDTLRLQVLSHGNYSKQNLLAVMKIANKTSSELLNLIPLNEAAKHINKLEPVEFTNFIKNLGVTTTNLENFYGYLGVTPINFLSYPLFIKIVTGFYDLLNPQEELATLISGTRVVTSNASKSLSTYKNASDILVTEYSDFNFELVENPLVQYPIRNVTLNNTEYKSPDIVLLEVKNAVVTGFAQMNNNYNLTKLNNCTYVSKLQYGGLYIENVTNAYMEKSRIVIRKTSNTVYNLGSPLFCQDKLFGFAVQENVQNISFATFETKMPGTTIPKPIIPPTIGQPSGNGSHPTAASKPNSASALFAFNIINITIGFAMMIRLLL